MTKRRTPLIFRGEDIPLGKPTPREAVPEESLSSTSEQLGRVNSTNLSNPVNSVNPANLVNSANSDSPSAPQRTSRLSPTAELDPLQILTVQQARELARRQIGPRVHPSYVVFLEELYHPIRHSCDGGVQTMLMGCLEIIKRNPELQQQVQRWATGELDEE